MKELIKIMQKKHIFTIVIEKDKNGFYAYCPQLQGCYSQGESHEKALQNIEDAIRLHVEDKKADGEKWREPEWVKVTSLELSL